jgi:hypothetical protein
MGIKFKNDAVSVLTGSLTTLSTDILIDAADDGKFPVIAAIGADYFYLTLEDEDHNIEIVKIVRHVSGSNNLETDGTVDSGVNRGLDGTTARTWSIGDVVEIRPNAAALEEAIAAGEAAGSAAQSDIDDHLADTVDAHDASAISYAGGGTGMAATDVEAAIDELANERKQVGKETIWVPAAAMVPTISSGCSFMQRVEIGASVPNQHVLDFDPTTPEYTQFQIAFPKSWDKGTITYQVFWTSGTANNDVVWSLEGVALANDDPFNTSYGTAVKVTDTMTAAANDVAVSAESAALTIANAPADGDECLFRMGRAAGDAGDTHAADARLLGVKIYFNTNAVNDA